MSTRGNGKVVAAPCRGMPSMGCEHFLGLLLSVLVVIVVVDERRCRWEVRGDMEDYGYAQYLFVLFVFDLLCYVSALCAEMVPKDRIGLS